MPSDHEPSQRPAQDAVRAVYNDLLQRLAQKTSLFTFRGFFEPLQLHPSSSAHVLVLAAPSAFHRDWVNDHYLDELRALATAGAQAPVDVQLIVGDAPAPAAATAPPVLDDQPPRPAAPLMAPRSAAPVVSLHRGDEAPAGIAGYPLDSRHTFDTFVEGPSNRMAFAACRAVAEAPAERYSPLFLFGNSGLGKTHLLQAIGNEARRLNPALRVVYLSAEQWVNEYITEIRNRRFDQFRLRYRNGLDILLVDDIQFLAGKDASQDEFFHTFNALYQCKKQIVVTADRYPHEIKGLASRLSTRLSWGLIADIQPPEMETRVAILERKAQTLGLDVPREVLHYLADHVRSSVRTLEGALLRISAYCSMTQVAPTLELVKDVLRPMLRKKESLSFPQIVDTVAAYYDMRRSDICGKSRQRSVTRARQLAMYLCRRHLAASLPEIGRFFGRDHTTVMASVRKVEGLLSTDAGIQAVVSRLEKTLG